jgi:DNA adenine methylase
MKPMIKYAGGKSREIEVIKRFIPEYKGRYIEPFFGGGALYFYLEPQKAIINDVNSKLIEFYLGIRNKFPQIKKELISLERQYVSNRIDFEKIREKTDIKVEDANEKLYYQMRDFFNNNLKSDFHPATVYFFINKTAYSGMIRYNKEGKYNVPYGRYKNFNTELVSENHSVLLKRSEIYCEDYKKIFDMSDKDDFIFLDPPYDCVFSNYGNKEMVNGFTEEMHKKLSENFKNLKSKALMVIGKTSFIEELYKDYIVYEYDKKYAVNIKNRFNGKTKHLIITNY